MIVVTDSGLLKSHVKAHTNKNGVVIRDYFNKKVKKAAKKNTVMKSSEVHADVNDEKGFRDAVFSVVKKRYSGKPPVHVSVDSDGASVLVAFSGLKHVLKDGHPTWKESLAALHAEALMGSAKHVETMPDRQGRAEIKAVHIYRSVAEVDGKQEVFRIVVREHQDGKRYYDHSMDEKSEDPAGLLADLPPESGKSQRPFTGSSNITIPHNKKQPVRRDTDLLQWQAD